MGSTQSTLDKEDLLKEIKKVKNVKFYLQGKEHDANSDQITPNTSLNHYLRNILKMTGTKGMCFEGGCGACVVVLATTDPATKKNNFIAVNSCLIPLLSCNDKRIFTIEGIGNAIDGYHPVQEVLAQFNGTQCGFCSPGMVMNMYALYESGKLTMEEVENSFSGNLCRCTGYRPILSAFKSLCTDVTPEVLGECPDMEDFVTCYKEKCNKSCKEPITISNEPFYLEVQNSKWIKVHTLRDLLKTLNLNLNLSYRLIAGNTAQGVFSSYKQEVDLYIDISEVTELQEHKVENDSCILGAGMTLNEAIEFLAKVAKDYSQFGYLKSISDHISLVANTPVRNRATLAGNLIIKHDHHEFPSDIFLVLETAGATITTVNLLGQEQKLSPLEFINYDMKEKRIVLKNITLPAYTADVKYVSYKIMARAQNVHAIVNAGYLFKFKNNFVQKATIVYGNINASFAHATKTEKLLIGKNLFDNDVLKQAYSSLEDEIEPNVIPPDPSPESRKSLSISLFYKAVLSIAPSDKISPKNKSGAEVLERPISHGSQDYETNKSLYPLTQAIPKLEALAQTSGEAQYIVDFPDLPGQLYGVLVQARAPPQSVIIKINADAALRCKDVVAFYTKSDIPGKNSFSTASFITTNDEEIFCDGTVKYYDQPLGVLIGENQKAVDDAVELIEVTYDRSNVEPLTSVRQVIAAGRTERIEEYKTVKASKRGKNIKTTVKGTFDIYHQYHFHMETHCCQIVPNETGLNVYSSTQFIDLTQIVIAKMLNINQGQIYMVTRRCGGAFGAKTVKNGQVACAAALAAWKLKKPVKMWIPLSTNMTAIGKRFPLSSDYEVGVDDKGVIQYLECSVYSDMGYRFNENIYQFIVNAFLSTYISDTFNVSFYRVATDTHTNTLARAPGSTEGTACMESIMEHISYATGLDPLEVRKANLTNKTSTADYIKDIKSWADIDRRRSEVESFNKENRWKKRGLAVAPMNFKISSNGPQSASVSIFNSDGSVQITHGGIEIGQGVNTKAAQVCAYKFKIPLEKITVLPSNSFVTPNTASTGASVTSDGVCYAVLQACTKLLDRIEPYRKATWEETIAECHKNNLQLIATGLYSPDNPDVKAYNVNGVCAVEVEVDVLTGQHIIRRVDLDQDAGVSLSPSIDIGQVEGAFIMALGYHTMEKIIFSYEGKILTNNTWTYQVPGAKDIPVEFNVKFPKNNPNPVGVLNSKGIGEASMTLGITISFAIRNALASARIDASPDKDKWYKIDGPTDIENIICNRLSKPSQYTL